MDLPKDVETWGDVVDRCVEKERTQAAENEAAWHIKWRDLGRRIAAAQNVPPVRIADLLAVPSAADLLAAGCRPAAVPGVLAALAGMAEQTRGAFLSMADDQLDAAAHHVRMVLGAPTLADVVRAALAAALFGWLP
mgnify:FL=1